MSFVKRPPKQTASGKTVNPAGGVNPALEPNVGQYGWTNFDAANVNQIIQYVNICKNYADEAKDAATYIQGVYGETQEFIKYLEAVYEELKPLADGLQVTYADIIVRHEDIIVKHTDIVQKFRKIEIWHSESGTYAEAAEASQEAAHISESNAKTSEVESEKWYDKSYELYEELRKGNIYRGTWNPHTGAYPDNGGTNSTWDVILNEGEVEYVWNGITWFWGDRLVYLKEANAYQQIESGTTVTSVNGKKGAVVLTATDVSALPLTGGTMTGVIQTSLSGNLLRYTNPNGNGVTEQAFVNDYLDYRMGSNSITKGIQLSDYNDPRVQLNRSGTVWTKAGFSVGPEKHTVYHQGYETTPQRIGALPITGGDIDGHVSILNDRNLTFKGNSSGTTGDILWHNGSVQTGRIWSSNETGLHISSNSSSSSTSGGVLTINTDNQMTIGTNKLYTEANKPTPQEIGAVSSSTTVNGKPLSADVVLGASDVDALPTSSVGTSVGNVLTVGALGLGHTSLPVPNGNNNQAKQSGFYGYTTTDANSPSSNGNIISQTWGIDTRWRTELALGVNDNKMFFRSILADQTNATNWVEVYHTENKPTVLDIKVSNPLTKQEETLMDVIEELRDRISQLEEKLNVQQ